MGRAILDARPFLLPGEPYLGPFEAYSAAELRQLLKTKMTTTSPLFIAIDGRSASGKTSLAKSLADQFTTAGHVVGVLHTDDFAWWHSYFDWHDMLREHAIEPLKEYQDIDYRPQAWVEREREGSITTPPNSDVIIIEGVGIGRPELADYFNWLIWVQSDYEEAYRRGVIRDLAERPDPVEAEQFWQEWQDQEVPFQADSKPWERAELAILSTGSDRQSIWVSQVKK